MYSHRLLSVLFLLSASSLARSGDAPGSPNGGDSDGHISLYGPEDSVVELVDANVTSIYNSEYLWIVEFYAHWCGHCQRFAPVWAELSRQFEGK